MPRSTTTSPRVAFLKGINVGGHRVTMDRLRDVFVTLGLTDVSTFIASGNVLFTAPALTDHDRLETQIQDALRQALGYDVATFVRTPADLAALVAHQPFPPDAMSADGVTVHVGFLRKPLDDAHAQALLAFRTTMDEFHVNGREFFWLCRGKTTESLVSWPKVTRQVKVETTMRNMTMIRKLAALTTP